MKNEKSPADEVYEGILCDDLPRVKKHYPFASIGLTEIRLAARMGHVDILNFFLTQKKSNPRIF